MKSEIKITKVSYSELTNKWYVKIDNLLEIETTERSAKLLIEHYDLTEINPFQYYVIS